MNDMALSPVADEATAVALAYELLRSDATGQARAETLEQIALILERLPSPQVADSRVQLFCACLDAIRGGSWLNSNAVLITRLGRAAWPREDASLAAPLARRWYSACGGVDVVLGRTAEAARKLARALVLAEQLDDAMSRSSAIANVAVMSAGAGAYEDALRTTR